MAKIKENKLSIIDVKYDTNLTPYQCPVSNYSYFGSCPNLSCPANVSQRRTNNSGCFFEKGKSNIIDVSRWTKFTTYEVKRRYNKGVKKLEKFTSFYNFLISYREYSSKRYCPKCGVPNSYKTGLKCLNGKRCDKRYIFYKKCLQRFPFNISVLNVSPDEFWATCLSKNMKDILSKKIIARAELLTQKMKAKNE